MKTSIKYFAIALLISFFFISCGGDEDKSEEPMKGEELNSIKLMISDNNFLAKDVTTKISKTKKEIKATIDVVIETSKFDDDIVLKAQIETSKNSVSKIVTIAKGDTEVPIEISLNGKKEIYKLKPTVNYINSALTSKFTPKDLASLYELSTNPLVQSFFDAQDVDFNAMTPDEFLEAITNIHHAVDTARTMFEITDDKITSLDLLDTDLSDNIPEEVFSFNDLETLNLNDTGATVLPASIGNLTKLKRFGIANTKITEIPKEIGQLVELEIFYAVNNPIKIFPSELGNCKNITLLNLSNNIELKEMPSFIKELTNLEELKLNECRITNIIPEIGNLNNLKKLKMGGNLNIETIPSTIRLCTKLKYVELHENVITAIPVELAECIKLDHIDLSDNKIKILPKELANIPNLNYLNLENNLIELVPNELKAKKYLNVKNNPIK